MNPERLQELKEARYLPGPAIINRYWLQGTLTTRTPLHIGTGEVKGSWKHRQQGPVSNNCNYVVLEQEGADGAGRREEGETGRPRAFPVIPGSSLRGALRSFLEGVLFPFNTPGRMDVASLSSTEYDADRGLTQGSLDALRVKLRGRAEGTDEERQRFVEAGMSQHLLRESDLVGSLFGTTHLRGRASFSDALVKTSNRSVAAAQRCFQIHTGVSIDRDTGAAAEGKLFDIELVRTAVLFQSEIRLSNARYWELGLLFLALEAFNHEVFPLHLGGLTQHGYGQMTWKLQEVYQLGGDKPSAGKLQDWLAGSGPQGQPQAGLAIASRGIPGVKGAAQFAAHCIKEFLKVMDDVRA